MARTLKYGGAIALCGLAGGTAVATTVMPFILRGISLLGIDSVGYPIAERRRLWGRLATDLRVPHLMDLIAGETGLDGVAAAGERILRGEVRGRTLVRLS
jgi:NADPH:quinone reductase-like Zn-dependent oxidoreductase